jgi:hypothetical protein
MSNIIEALTETVRGRVITRSDPDYDEARAVYNAMYDRKPRAVIQCVDSADVMAAIEAGQDLGRKVADKVLARAFSMRIRPVLGSVRLSPIAAAIVPARLRRVSHVAPANFPCRLKLLAGILTEYQGPLPRRGATKN